MTDPLKLPLRIDGMKDFRLIWDDEGSPVAYVRALEGPAVAQHRAEVIAAALTADAEPTPAVVIPSVDYTQIPPEYAGKWVLVRIRDQRVVRVGASPEDAMGGYDPESPEFVLTQVPAADTKPWIYHSEQDSAEYADAEKGERDG